MTDMIKYLLALIIAAAGIFLIFYLIFPEVSLQMMWCVLTGSIFIASLLSNVLTLKVSARSSILKVSANIIFSGITGIAFVWTLLYVFLSSEWQSAERNLTALYVGYLIIGVVGTLLMFGTDSGVESANLENKQTQKHIASKKALLLNLDRISSANTSSYKRELSNIRSLLQSTPAKAFSHSGVYEEIANYIEQLRQSLACGDNDNIKKSIRHFINLLNQIK